MLLQLASRHSSQHSPSQAQSVGDLPSFMQVKGGQVIQSPLTQTFVSKGFYASGEISPSTETFTKSKQ